MTPSSSSDSFEPIGGWYVTPAGRRVAAEAVTWFATRSGGPGGQHANTSDTAVTVSIDVARSGLPEVQRHRVETALGATVSASSAASRSQWRNRQLAWKAAMSRLDAAAAPPPPPRAPTKPSRGAREARLRDKHHATQRKESRRRPTQSD